MASDDDGLTREQLSANAVHISSPGSGEVKTRSMLAVSGGVQVPVFVHVRKIGAGGVEIPLGIGYPLLTPGGPWAAAVVLGEGEHTIIAVAVGVDGYEIPSAPVSFSVRLALPAPQINRPEAGSVQDVLTWIGGTGADYSAQVQFLEDFTHQELGNASVTLTGKWGLLFQLAPGSHSIVARQTINGRQGPVGTARFFKVRPPRLSNIAVTLQANQSVKLSGAGYNGTTVEIAVISGPPGALPPPAVEVKNSHWETTATNWPLGIYRLSAIQKLPDNAGGWIPSEASEFDVSLEEAPVPDPTNVDYSYEQYTPTFFGRGVAGATVLMSFADGSTAAPDAPVMGGAWSSRSTTAWGPTWQRQVQFKQQLDGQVSPGLVSVDVTIPPLAPIINDLVDNDLSPVVFGTCWPGAGVELVFSNSPVIYTPVISAGHWNFRHPDKFAPGVTHTVTVTQTVAQQTSPPTSRTFEVGILTKPIITEPLHETDVTRDLRVRGTDSVNGARMQMRVDGIEMGPASLTGGGLWYIDLKGLAFGRRILDAQQTLGDRASERSDPVAVYVVLMPPAFTTPLPGGDLPRVSRISGEGVPGATVEVWLDGRDDFLLRGVSVNAAGRWEGLVALPVGVTTLRARQAIEQLVSNDSPPLTCNVVPAAPYIETPVNDSHVGRSTVVSGFGIPGDTVTVRLGEVGLGSAPVLEDRTWSVPVTLVQPGGAHVLVAVAACDGFESDHSAQRPVMLGSYVPIIDTPQAGRWLSNPVGFSGQGRPGIGQLVSWFNPEQPWAPDLAVSTQGWQGVALRALPPSGNWCRFKQTIVDGADASTISDWSESGRFEVLGPLSP